MVKKPNKTQGITNNPQNSLNQTLKLDSKLSKSRQQINQENYQRSKDQRKEKRRQRYQQKKLQNQLETQQQLSKYYTAEAIKVLMSFKEYTELNKEKKQLWLDFNWTAKDYQKSIEKGYADIVMIMKLEETAHNLVRDYWDTAKSEEKQKGKSWNILDYDEQQRLIRYWGYEKARIENGYIDGEERLERKSQEYLKEIELAKFHEERGKVKCSCYACEEKKEIQNEIKTKWKQELVNYDRQSEVGDKEQCPECQRWVKELDEESGICKSCKQKYE